MITFAGSDPNDVLREHGEEELRYQHDRARHYNGRGAALDDGEDASGGSAEHDRANESKKAGKGTRTSNNADTDKAKTAQADALIELVDEFGVELFHAPDGMAYAILPVNGHFETHSLKARRGGTFRKWLRRQYYIKTKRAPNSEAMVAAVAVIEAHAEFEGDEREVYLRVADLGDRIYLDIGDATWRAIEVTEDGWRIVTDPPVRFRRAPGMRPLPMPEEGGNVDDLKQHLAVEGDAFVLVVSFILTALRGRKPYPILALAGEQGTGKSTTAEMIRRLIDPNSAALRSLSRDTRDLAIAANNGHVVAFDNLSGIPTDISDALCRLATGAGFSTRSLFTDDEETLFKAARPIILTSIDDVATRSDLADRSLLASLEPIPEDNRKTEKEVWSDFDKTAPKIMGALLDMVAHGLRNLVTTHLGRLPRMADYALWAAACETHAWPKGTHLAAYTKNRNDAAEMVLDADPVAQVLRQYMAKRGQTTTTAAELLRNLNDIVTEQTRRDRSWPLTSRALAGRLKRLGPALRKVGITIERPDREAGTGRRLITITAKAAEE
jgi:hypothetical protein